MSYDKAQATREFSRWSVGYDRSILQWLLFGPAHRAIISRLQARSGDRPTTILDVGCGTGVFAARIAAALPRATIWGVDLVDGMLTGGRERWQALRDQAVPVQGDSERLPFRRRGLRCGDLRQQLPPLPAPGSGRGGDVPRPQAWGAAVSARRLPRQSLGMVHL